MVLVLLFTVSVITIGRSHFSSYVADRTARAVMGDIALGLAEDALTEARRRLVILANTPGSEQFDFFRQDGFPGTTTVTISNLPALDYELHQNDGFSLYRNRVEAVVEFETPLSSRLPTPHDRFGLLTLIAEIRHDRTGTLRRLKETYEFQVNLTGPPVPFGTYTLFIADGVFLINGGTPENDANKCMEQAIHRLEELDEKNKRFISDCDSAIDVIQRAGTGASLATGSGDDLRKAIRAVRRSRRYLSDMRSRWPKIRLEPFGIETTGIRNALHRFPEPPICLISYARTIDLATLDLPDTVATRISEICALEKKLTAAAKECHDFLSAKPSDLSRLPGLIQSYCKRALEVAEAYRTLLLNDYKKFQDSLIEVAGKSYDRLMPFIEQFHADDFIGKASAVIGEFDTISAGNGKDISERLNSFLDSVSSFNGVLLVVNPKTALVIDRTFRGRLVLVVTGDLTVRNALVNDRTTDSVTLVCFGKMTLSGPSQATLMPLFSFNSAGSQSVEGGLIFSRLNFLGGTPSEVMSANITRPLGASTRQAPPGEEHYVSLSPSPVFVEVSRR